jgi:hypothetical protein
MTGVMTPLGNPRMRTAALQPTAHYLLLELDVVEQRTAAGLLLPDGSRAPVFSDADMKRRGSFAFDQTARVVAMGPEAEGFSIGDRVVLPCPPVPVPVVDGETDVPLGVLDCRDILLKVTA